MTKYMKRFGFYAKPPLDYPPDEMTASRPYSPTRSAVPAGQPERGHRPDRRSVRAGCEVTPLQMAMVAAAVANGGKLMTPRLADQGRRPGRAHGEDLQALGVCRR